MKACVTGAAGFIGSHLCDIALERGWIVIGLDDLSSGKREHLTNAFKYKNFSFIKASVLSQEELESAFQGCDVVFHLAGKADIVPSINDPRLYHDVNVNGTVNVLEAMKAAKCERVVYAASSSCYGLPKTFPTPETEEIACEYPYAMTKRLGEECVLHWSKVYGIQAVSLRLFNVYGTRSRTSGAYGAVLGVFLAQKLAGKPLTNVGDGEQKRDFVFVKDVAKAFILAAEKGTSGEIYNVGGGKPRSVNELADLLRHPLRESLPKRPGEPDLTFADISKIKHELEWMPETSFEKGVGEVLENIDLWKEARAWSSEEIGEETKNWFKFLGSKNRDEG